MQVYGEAVIQIDLFHVMQELNRAIKADLKQYREQRFDVERRELRLLRNWVNSIQNAMKEGKDFKNSLTMAGTLPKIKLSHEFSSKCLSFTLQIIELVKITLPNHFFQTLQGFITTFPAEEPYTTFIDKISKFIPKKRFTEKGMHRIKTELLKKLKTFYLWFRKPMDEESIQFYHDFYIIFVQPENMTPKRKELLEEFLTAHPDLKRYSKMTLLLGELSRLSPDEIDGHQIDDLHEDPSFSKKLNTALTTIKKYKLYILRFVDFFKKNPELSKAQHSNMEYYNLKFKEPFKSGNNLLKKERVLGRLDTQLSGKIEWFLEEEVII